MCRSNAIRERDVEWLTRSGSPASSRGKVRATPLSGARRACLLLTAGVASSKRSSSASARTTRRRVRPPSPMRTFRWSTPTRSSSAWSASSSRSWQPKSPACRSAKMRANQSRLTRSAGCRSWRTPTSYGGCSASARAQPHWSCTRQSTLRPPLASPPTKRTPKQRRPPRPLSKTGSFGSSTFAPRPSKRPPSPPRSDTMSRGGWRRPCCDGRQRIRLIGFGNTLLSHGTSHASVAQPVGCPSGIAVSSGQRGQR